MSYLFYIDDRNNTVLHPDCLKLCPELSGLTQDEALCLILIYDNFSPYRQYPEQQRIYKASLHVFSDNNHKLFDSNRWKLAVDAYKSLQYNPKLELVKTYQKKIEEMQLLIEETDSETQITKALKVINELRKNILELENEVLDGFQRQGQLAGKAERSFLEILMSNKELYSQRVLNAKR